MTMVVARANATEYGLGGSVWGKDEDKALEIAERIAEWHGLGQ
jgi:acyl-CoA reductase-like NAD-dependent aldehyde dehydrogenase